MKGRTPAPGDDRNRDDPPTWLVVSLLAISMAMPLLPAAALLLQVKIIVENFGAVMAAGAGISVAALSALGFMSVRVHIRVSVRPDRAATAATHPTIEAEFSEHPMIEVGERISVDCIGAEQKDPGRNMIRH